MVKCGRQTALGQKSGSTRVPVPSLRMALEGKEGSFEVAAETLVPRRSIALGHFWCRVVFSRKTNNSS